MKQYLSYLRNVYSFLYRESDARMMFLIHQLLKVTSIVFIIVTCVVLFFFGRLEKTAVVALVILVCVFVFLPDFLMMQKFKKKKDRLIFGLADFMDRTAILLDSGMPLWTALCETTYSSNQEDPFSAEMMIAVRSFSGKNGYFYRPEEAMELFAERCSIRVISSFVSLIVQNSRKGSDELASIFKAQSMAYRTEQRNMAKKRAEEASALMLFPTAIVFIAILAMVATPAILTVMSGMSV